MNNNFTITSTLPSSHKTNPAYTSINGSATKINSFMHKTFNGYPKHIDETLGMMYDVKLYGNQLAQMPMPGQAGYNIGPVFEYMAVQP